MNKLKRLITFKLLADKVRLIDELAHANAITRTGLINILLDMALDQPELLNAGSYLELYTKHRNVDVPRPESKTR